MYKIIDNSYFGYLKNSSNIIANYILILVAFLIPTSTHHIKYLFIMLSILSIFRPDALTKLKSVLVNPVVISFALYFLLNLLWLSVSKNPEDVYYIAKYSVMFLYPVLILLFLESKFIPLMISSFLLGIFVSEIVSYDLYLNLNTFDFFPYINANANSTYPTPFMSHLNYGFFLAFSAGLSLQIFFQKNSYLMKIFTIILIVSITINQFINIGRSGYILYAISILTILYLQYKKDIFKYIPLIIVAFVSIFFLAYSFSPNFQKRIEQTVNSIASIYNKENYTNSIGIRFMNYKNAIESFKQSPLIGYGTDAHVTVLYEETKKTDAQLAQTIKNYHTTDSQYFDIALQFGLIGLIVFFNIFYQIYRYKDRDIYLKNISILMSILLLIYGLGTNFMHFLNPTSYLLIFFATITMSHSYKEEYFDYKSRVLKLYLLDAFTFVLLYVCSFHLYRFLTQL
ncbi:MAG: O-antigen ligase family protein [Campylobacterota bacterium]|nr:O-antigen ligase family protein [Campylobacterota bacterium]